MTFIRNDKLKNVLKLELPDSVSYKYDWLPCDMTYCDTADLSATEIQLLRNIFIMKRKLLEKKFFLHHFYCKKKEDMNIYPGNFHDGR